MLRQRVGANPQTGGPTAMPASIGHAKRLHDHYRLQIQVRDTGITPYDISAKRQEQVHVAFAQRPVFLLQE